ncbi:hypothetical protein Tco_1421091 [Tanacetum coccineum]
MANLEFSDTHNMVAYLLKPEESKDFQQIVDFLNISHIKFALIENPIIYTLLIQQFWQTASTSTLEDREVEITATIDGQLKTITEASLRRHLKLEDADDTSLSSRQPKKARVVISDELKKDLEDPSKQLEEKLEKKVKTNKARRRARIVISEDEDAEEDSSKQGRKISDIDKDPTISLVHPEQDMEYDFDVSTAEGFTTASVPVTTASATPEVSTTAANLVYIRRSAEKRKDKGKAIMKDDESVQKKSKKDAEIAKHLQEEFDRARQEQEVVAKAHLAHDINWSNPVVLRYHALQNRSFSIAEVRKNMCMYLKNQGGYKLSYFKEMSYKDIRPIFERVWDQNNAFVPKDFEIKKEVMKRSGFTFQQKSSKKRSREDTDEDNAKKQKLEDDAEKKELRDSIDVVPRDDIAIDVESLATKYPIVDWKTHVLTENMIVSQCYHRRTVASRKPPAPYTQNADTLHIADSRPEETLALNLIYYSVDLLPLRRTPRYYLTKPHPLLHSKLALVKRLD